EELLYFPKPMEQTKGTGDHRHHVGYVKKLIENFKTRFDNFMLGKQVLLCIDNPFLVRNMREFSAETRQIFPWAKAASLPSEFMTSRKTLHSKGLGETFSPSGKRW
ncbi:hypothetical protein GOODEAATRI_032059, partial [Goodea atripinnis]